MNPQNDCIYYKGEKKDVPEANLFHHSNRQSKKVMVSACLSWNGATKPLFVNDKGVKVNAVSYKRHLEKKLLSSVEKLFTYDQWIFLQDGAPSHRSNLVQDFLKEKSSPDFNPLDFYFWDAVKEKVYGDRLYKPFKNEDKLKQKIQAV